MSQDMLKDAMQTYIDYKLNLVRHEGTLSLKDKTFVFKEQYNLLLTAFDFAHLAPNKLETELWVTNECKSFLLPKVEILLRNKQLKDEDYVMAYETWKNVFALTARRSLHHFMLYTESDRELEGQTYLHRQDLLKPIIDNLEQMTYEPDFKYIAVSLPPGYGKSLIMWKYRAWVFGINQDHSFLNLSYSENLVIQFSLSVQELMLSELYQEIFPHFREYMGTKNNIFDKTKATDWKLKDTPQTPMSHISRSRDGGITGVRANFMITFDDMTKGREEAYNEDTHAKYWGQYTTEWVNRKSSSNVKEAFIGTMWSPNDLLGRSQDMIMSLGDKHNVIHEYGIEHIVEVLKDRKKIGVVIKIPQLDENEKSTCEHARTTEEALMLRANTSDFEWNCVYQQQPIAQEGRPFDYSKLRQYGQYTGKGIILTNGNDIELSDYAKMVIDPTRRGIDNVAVPIYRQDINNEKDFYLVDAIFKGVAMDEVYDDIVTKIFQHNVNEVVIETNTATSGKAILTEKIRKRNDILGKNLVVEIKEEYATKNKALRIKDESHAIITHIVFPEKGLFPMNSDVGRFMDNVIRYSFDFPNKHDDAPDSLAMTSTRFIKSTIRTEASFQTMSSTDLFGG